MVVFVDLFLGCLVDWDVVCVVFCVVELFGFVGNENWLGFVGGCGVFYVVDEIVEFVFEVGVFDEFCWIEDDCEYVVDDVVVMCVIWLDCVVIV